MNPWMYQGGGFMMPRMTRAVKILLITTVVVFAVQILSWLLVGQKFDIIFGLNDLVRRGFVWQLVTYMFLHARMVWHILINMLALYFLGPEIERTIGTRRFFTLYFLCGLVGAMMWLLLSSGGVCVGASAAVFGMAVTFGMLFPNRRITLLLFLILPVTITGKMLAIGAGLLALLPILIPEPSNIAHAAHLGGAVAAYFYVRVIGRSGFSYGQYSYPQNSLRNWGDNLVQKWRRRKIRVVFGKPKGDAAPSQTEVDTVLEKLGEGGWSALTKRDRDILDRASKR